MSSYNFCFMTCIQISQEAGKMVWYSPLFKNFPQFVVIHKVKGFGIVNKAKICFSGTLSLFQWSSEYWHLISGSSAFLKSCLNIWNFTVHVLPMPGLESFEHYFASLWNVCNHAVEHSLALPLLGIDWGSEGDVTSTKSHRELWGSAHWSANSALKDSTLKSGSQVVSSF